MRRATSYAVFALLSLLASAGVAVAAPESQLIVIVREYPSGRPLGGVSLNVTLWIGGRTLTFNALTNPVGMWNIQLDLKPQEAYLVRLSVAPANFTGFSSPQPALPVRVADTMIDEIDYRAAFIPSANVTELSELRIPLQVTQSGNVSLVRCAIWIAPARFVNVSVLDPVTRRPTRVTVKPGVPLAARGYLQPYLLPIGYPVLVRADTPLAEARQLRFWVTNETRLVPWSYYAADAFLKGQLATIDDSLRQLEAIGYPTEEFRREASLLRAVAWQALIYFERGNYTTAIGALLGLVNGVNSLRGKVDNLFSYSQLAAVGVILLTLAFAHVLSALIFERRRHLFVTRLALLVALILFALYTSPTMRVAAAGLLGTLGVPMAALDYPTLVAGTLLLSFLAYSLLLLFSAVSGPVRGFWLQIALRYMKSKRLRTVLVLTAMTLVVSSVLAVSGVTIGSAVMVKSGRGSGFYGLDVEVDTIRRPTGMNLSEVEWLRALVNATAVGRMATPPPNYLGVLVMTRASEAMILTQMVAIDISFAARYFNLTAALYDGRLPRDGAAEILLPKGFSTSLSIGDSVWLFFAQPSAQGPPSPAGPVWDTPVRVVGFFDPLVLNGTLDPELRPLFGDLARVNFLVIAPFDPLARRLALSRVWLLTANATPARDAAQLVFTALPVTVHVLEGNRVTTYERTLQLSFRGQESLVLLVIAALMNAMVMLGHVEDRRRDVYTMATLGADPKNLFNAMIVEASIIGIVASYLGWLLAPVINLVPSFFTSLFGGAPIVVSPPPVESLFYAAGLGLATSVLSAYVPSRRASGLSRMGREERKVISPSELKLVGGMAIYELPVRVSVFESEALYRYLKEILPKKDILGEEVYLDGTFAISFAILPPHMRGTLVTCRLRTVKRGDSLILQLEVPEEYRSYIYLSDVIYALETKLLDYSKWRDTQFRYQILRYAPRREVLTLDALLERSSNVMARARELELKLRRLDEMKATISTSLYTEYERKYRRELNMLIRELLTLSLRLEPFVSQLRDEMRKLESEREKHRVAYELGELSEAEYRAAVEPIEKQLDEYASRLKMIEEVNSFLASRRR
ncbi:MAG: FtsX-like permease family protein [Thermofilaceae archaeon]